MYDTGESTLFDRPFFANASGTLEGYLLDAWFTGNNTYNALFLDAIPNNMVRVDECRILLVFTPATTPTTRCCWTPSPTRWFVFTRTTFVLNDRQ